MLPAADPLADPTLSRRATVVVEELLDRAGRQLERALSLTRLAVSALTLALILLAAGGDPFASTNVTCDVGALLVAIGASVGLLAWLKRTRDQRAVSLATVVFDALLIFWFLAKDVFWPYPEYRGLLNSYLAMILSLVVLAAAIRPARVAARVGIALTSASFLILLGLDVAVHGARLAYRPMDAALALTFFSGFAMLGSLLAQRTRRLVFEAAEATLRAERVRQRLGAYVSEEVAQAVIEQGPLLLGGARQQIAVLFTDLRGFTAYAEKLDPERLVTELNAYLDAMVQAIRVEGGVVDKYIGDSIMAVFGIPSARPDDAARAVRTAARMQAALRDHNAERARRGLPALCQGIGVHWGPAIAGNIGTPERLQYTVLGDTVNLASRLESATKEHGVEVLVSAEALEAARSCAAGTLPASRPVARIRVRGREAELDVHTLAPPEEAACASCG